MRTVPTCAEICTLSLAALASADVYVFDNAATFGLYTSAVGLIDQQQNFNGYAGTYPSVTGGSGNFAWTASAPSGLFVNGSSVARTLSSPETLTFTFASSNGYSVGGSGWNRDGAGRLAGSQFLSIWESPDRRRPHSCYDLHAFFDWYGEPDCSW